MTREVRDPDSTISRRTLVQGLAVALLGDSRVVIRVPVAHQEHRWRIETVHQQADVAVDRQVEGADDRADRTDRLD